jgi:membrane-associated phospholipid phosphatase
VDAQYAFELQILQAFQTLNQGLVPLMRFFTFLGKEQFYLLVMPLLYWCIDRPLGIRVGIMLTLSASLNDVLKLAFHSPRPFWINPSVEAIEFESSFGIPSGHAQNAVAVWGTFASRLKARWIWIVAVLLMLFIGLSRLFLGVHFPRDVLTGWLIGAVILALFLVLEHPIGGWFRAMQAGKQIAILLAVSLGLSAVGWVEKGLLEGWELPSQWIQNAASALPAGEVFNPLSLAGLLTSTGAFVGLTSGALWIERRGGFTPSSSFVQGLLRFLLGLVGVLLLWFGLGAVFPHGETWLAYLFRYIRYSLVGLWISAWAPWLFLRLRLAEMGR